MKSLTVIKLVILLLLCNCFAILSGACQTKNDFFQENLVANRMRDISDSDNILNTIVRQEDKFYYVNEAAGEKIYSVFMDGTKKKKLNNCESSIIGVKEGWIYYSNITKNSDLYKMKIDGTENKKLNSADGYAILYGDWIYYLFESSNIYRTKIDGSAIKKITSDHVYDMKIVGDWIYYINRSDRGSLYKIKIDGTEKTKLNNVDTYSISFYKDWVIFLNYDDHQRIYKVKTDGTNFSGFVNYEELNYSGCFDNIERLTINGDWIYYCNPEINRVKADNPSMVNNINSSGNYGFTVEGDWIYFWLAPNLKTIGRVNIDGTTINPQAVN